MVRTTLLTLLLGSAAASPCVLQAHRQPERGLAPTYVYTFVLRGDCARVPPVQVGLASDIGGTYPQPPLRLDRDLRVVRSGGNLPWWYPVKITATGLVPIPYRESP